MSQAIGRSFSLLSVICKAPFHSILIYSILFCSVNPDRREAAVAANAIHVCDKPCDFLPQPKFLAGT